MEGQSMGSLQSQNKHFIIKAEELCENYSDIIRHWEVSSDIFKRSLALTILQAAGKESRKKN